MEKPSLKVCLFGDFRLLNRGEVVTGLRGRSQQLLAYLILHRQAPQPRRRIAEALWPETQTSQALTNLRKELHYLRQANAPIDQLLAIASKTLHWRPQIPCEVDIVCLETAFATAENAEDDTAVQALETALLECQGELWPDCDAAWIYPEQVRIRQGYIRAIAKMTQLLQSSGEASRAIGFGQRWLQADPLDEGATQILMTLYGDGGDRATALRLYHQCMTTLQTELGVNPSPTTANIYQQLLLEEEEEEGAEEEIASVPPVAPVLSKPRTQRRIVGRDDLLQMLDQWRLSPDEQAPLLLLSGEPGIGKTNLLEALEARAQQHHWQVFWGSAFAAEQLRAYGVWIDLLQAAPQKTSQKASPKKTQSSAFTQSLSALLGASADLQNRGQLLDAVVQDLQTMMTPEHPVLLLLDDIHWLDEASTTLLHYVFRLLGHRSLGDGALRIACAARRQELQENTAVLTLVTALRRSQQFHEVVVPPLSDEAVRTLVSPILNKSLEQVAIEDADNPLDPDRVIASSGGNPLFALEVARANGKTTSNLQGLIDDRLQRLDGAARDLLPWAAALGRRFNPEILALAASYPPMLFLSAMEQLEKQQIVRPVYMSSSQVETILEQGNYDFVHDLVRQGAYNVLSFPRRKIIHGQLAKTLEAQMLEDDLASQVAYHAGLAGNHALAAQASGAAALRSLRLFAYEAVIQLVSQGLNHCQFLPSYDRLLQSAQLFRTRVLAGVSQSETMAVRQQIEQLLSEMTGLNLVDAELIARQALTLLSYQQGDINNVHQQCLKSLDMTSPAPRVQAEALSVAGACLSEIERDMERAEGLLLEAQSLATRLGLSFSDIDLGLGSIHRYRGDYDLAQQYLQQALQLSRLEHNQMNEACSLINLVMNCWDSHQPAKTYAQTLKVLSPHLPQGSDGALAEALIGLQAYKQSSQGQPTEQKEMAQSVSQALKALEALDAQRRIVFVASHGTEVALSQGDRTMALKFARRALKAARVVDHPNDRAIAEALCLLSMLTTKAETPASSSKDKMIDQETIPSHWNNLKSLNRKRLSARAQRLIAEVTEKMK